MKELNEDSNLFQKLVDGVQAEINYKKDVCLIFQSGYSIAD